MSDDFSREQENSRNTRHRTTAQAHLSESSAADYKDPSHQLHIGSLLPGNSLGERGRGNSSIRANTMQSAQQTYGNRAVQRFVQRTASGAQAEDDQAPKRASSIRTATKPVQRMGWQRPSLVPDGYLYSNQNQKGGLDFGLGYGSDAEGDFPGANGNLGVWGENNNKDTRYGLKLGGGMAKGQYKGDSGGAEAGILSGNAEASFGTNGASLGVGGNFVGVDGRYGKPDPNSITDTSIHGGLSAGPSLGFRAHWSDDDKDNLNEVGFGFDAGPVSFDLKSELPHTILKAMNPNNWVNEEDLPRTPDPMDGGAPTGLPDGGVTNSIMGAGRSAMDWLGL